MIFKVEINISLDIYYCLKFNLASHKGGLASGLFDGREFFERKASLENTRPPAHTIYEQVKTYNGEK